jgi:hypothetical protein
MTESIKKFVKDMIIVLKNFVDQNKPNGNLKIARLFNETYHANPTLFFDTIKQLCQQKEPSTLMKVDYEKYFSDLKLEIVQKALVSLMQPKLDALVTDVLAQI